MGLRKERGPFVCQQCDKEYMTRRPPGEGETFCSRECSTAHQKANKNPKVCSVYTGYCSVCDGPIVNKVQRTVCSRECEKAKNRQRYYIAYKVRHDSISCGECGALFTPLDGSRSLCSSECGNARRNRVRALKRKNEKDRTHKQRARKYGVPYQSVDPIKVFKRDNWKCQACDCDTPQHLRGTNDDNAPELDHIVALVNGGEHSYSNTQCLCRLCNNLKGTMDNEDYKESIRQ